MNINPTQYKCPSEEWIRYTSFIELKESQAGQEKAVSITMKT